MRRGEDLIANGDLASARLVLQRAAEAGDPGAALRLPGTYDPIVLEQRAHQDLPRMRISQWRALGTKEPRSLVRKTRCGGSSC